MTWFVLTLSSAFCWGIGQVLIKRGFDHLPPLWYNIINNILSIFVWIIPVLLLTGFRVNIPSIHVILIIFTASSLYHIFFYSIEKGQISLTGTVIAGYPVITLVLSYMFLHERLTPYQYMGIFCILAGSSFVTLPERNTKDSKGDFTWIVWGFSGAVLIGTGDFFSKLSINEIGSFSHMFFLVPVSNTISFFNYLIDRENRKFPKIFHRQFLPSFVGLVIHLFGVFLFYLAFDYGKLSLVVSVSSIYPAFVLLFAVKLLKERITLKQGLGISSITIGLIIVGLGSKG